MKGKLIAILCIIAVIVIVNFPVKDEAYSEIYFKQPLPKALHNSTADFVLENHENTKMDYDLEVLVFNDEDSVVLDTLSVSLEDEEIREFSIPIVAPSSWTEVRVQVNLLTKDKSIHFYATKAVETMVYGDRLVVLDCVGDLFPLGTSMIINGSYSPTIEIWKDGVKSAEMNLSERRTLVFETPGIRDVVFTNDHYEILQNETIDRNVYIELISAGNATFQDVTVDYGDGLDAFDCYRATRGTVLYRNGAFRFRIG